MTDPDQLPDPAPHSDPASHTDHAPRYAPPPGYVPEHPYAAPPRQQGTAHVTTGGIADVSMGLGLAAVLTVVVSALYLTAFAAVGALLGAAAIVLGTIGLVKRRRRWTGITGVVSGAVAALGAVALLLIAVFGLAADAIGAASAARGGSGSQGPQASSAEWPESFATGALLFSGDASGVRMVEPQFEAGTDFPVEADTDADRVRVYVDYSCPYCSMFEEANGDTLEELLAGGDALVEVVPLNFLDRVSMGARYSSRASGAMTCLAELQPGSAWSAHRALLSAEFQPAEGTTGPDDAALIANLEAASGSLSPDVVSCIQDRRYVDFAQRLNDWVSEHPVPGAVDPAARVDSTPFIMANGVRYTGDPADAASFRGFLAEQGIGID